MTTVKCDWCNAVLEGQRTSSGNSTFSKRVTSSAGDRIVYLTVDTEITPPVENIDLCRDCIVKFISSSDGFRHNEVEE